MPVTDIVVDEIVATVRTVDSASMLDPKLVRRLVHSLLAGSDERRSRERRRRDNSRVGEEPTGEREAGW